MTKKRSKISIIGAGNVGTTFAFALMTNGISRDIILIDRNKKLAEGQSMDLNHGISFTRPVEISSGGFESCADSDIIVITAGAKQKPGQTRLDLTQANTELFKEIIPQVLNYAPDAILLVVTNPVDILTYATLKISSLPSQKVLGSGTILDTSRLRYITGAHCGIDTRNINAYIIGEHGDTELPVWSNATIGGMKIKDYCSICAKKNSCKMQKELDDIADYVRNSAYSIIESKGATYYAIALSLVKITESIIRDENSILPVSVLINDYYNINDICLSLPSVVNKNGASHYLNIELSKNEQQKLISSAKTLKDIIKKINF